MKKPTSATSKDFRYMFRGMFYLMESIHIFDLAFDLEHFPAVKCFLHSTFLFLILIAPRSLVLFFLCRGVRCRIWTRTAPSCAILSYILSSLFAGQFYLRLFDSFQWQPRRKNAGESNHETGLSVSGARQHGRRNVHWTAGQRAQKWQQFRNEFQLFNLQKLFGEF